HSLACARRSWQSKNVLPKFWPALGATWPALGAADRAKTCSPSSNFSWFMI
ncbi:hypothetical protein A2U01_0092692, partial [Trifolium medium]|nr:hypothetical protein [Trifolium medium]